jgi:RsiW-degrading membrane proteinase PrsW (M82 family)
MIQPAEKLSNGEQNWEICDLNSSNGTYVNGRRIKGCQKLTVGDHISLSKNGPEFLVEYIAPRQKTVITQTNQKNETSNQSLLLPQNSLTFTQLFPIVSTGRDLTRKAYLIPGSITVLFVVLMFATLGNANLFNLLLGAYLGVAGYYCVYQLCGKRKPWWWLLGSAIATSLVLLSPLLYWFILVFREILPGSLPDGAEVPFLQLLITMFFGAGLMEELLKSLPVLMALAIGRYLRSPWRERLGVWEPLDGILLGSASAVGFTLLETLGQYVPQIVQEVGELQGLQLLIPRILGSVAGHMAYSGYLGYFIGLSVLNPKQRWLILGVGYLCAAVLHALWNSTVVLGYHVLAIVGILSYAFLGAAILKARSLSPTRSENFATQLRGK